MKRSGHLSLLWASISAASWLVPTAGPQPTPVSPPPPALSLAPLRDIFNRGEKFRLTCTPPKWQRAVEFLFYKWVGNGDKWALQTQQQEDTWEVSTEHLEPRNIFICLYKGENTAGEPVMSAQSDNRVVAITGPHPTPVSPPPPAPRLSLVPRRDIFIRGETFRLTCTPPESQKAAEFLFYKMMPGGKWALQIQQKEGTWEVSTAHLEPRNTFTCVYTGKNNAGIPAQSAQSGHREVAITELQPAALSLDPKYPVYLQGEKVTLICSAPEEVKAAGYIFYKEQQDQTLKELPSTGQGPYKTFKVYQNTAGKYICTYWMLLSKQEIRSPHSGPVSVAVTKRLRPPVLSVSPKREVYRSGEFINFTCSISDSRPVSKIMFHKDDRRLHEPHQLSSSPDRNTYTLRLSPQDGGRYSCTYHVVESGREIPSTKSDNTHISVMAVPGPESSTAHTYESKRRITRSPAAPTISPLQVTSSHPVMEESSPSAEPDRPAPSLPSSSQSTCSAVPVTVAAPESSAPTFSKTTAHDRVSGGSSTTFQDSAKPFTGSGGPRSTLRPRTASKAKNGNGMLPLDALLPLVAGCSGAAVLFLAFMLWLFRKKQKGNSRRLSRSLWKSLKGHHSRRVSRINCPSRTHLELQEKAKSQEVDQDWGILPKSKPVSSKCGDPARENQVNDDADSGAEFEFPDLDPTYTLLGYACSTFFLAESDLPAEDSHV